MNPIDNIRDVKTGEDLASLKTKKRHLRLSLFDDKAYNSE